MISRKRREQGTVVLLIRIESGRVTRVDVERSSGHKPLDESAARAVREWRFDVTGYDGAITARIPFSFTLK
jgi:protein TonB